MTTPVSVREGSRSMLPKWPFYVGNLALVGIAVMLALRTTGHLSAAHFFWCFVCVMAGTALFIYPFVQEFKAHLQLQKSRNTSLGKDHLTRIDALLIQVQELSQALQQHSQKHTINHNLLNNHFASLETALDAIQDKLTTTPQVAHDNSGDLTTAIANLQSQLDIQTQALLSLSELIAKAPTAPEPQAPQPTIIPSEPHVTEPTFFELPSSLERTHEPAGPYAPFSNTDSVEFIFSETHQTTEPNLGDIATCHFDITPETTHTITPHTVPTLDTLVQERLSHTDDLTIFEGNDTLESPTCISQHLDTAYTLQNQTDAQTATAVIIEEPLTEPTPPKRAVGTLLTVNAMLGIGKKPFIRGQGPGLNWNRGVPMEFVEMGKWQWTSSDSSQPIICRVYKNDETPADGEVICIQPGEQLEITPVFKS